jgi:hypothetical protein
MMHAPIEFCNKHPNKDQVPQKDRNKYYSKQNNRKNDKNSSSFAAKMAYSTELQKYWPKKNGGA